MTTIEAKRSDRPHWSFWLLLAVLIIGFVAVGCDAAIHFDDTPIDGPFQLFNALRRLAAGQRFGGSFQYFHGPGVAYLHLLPFLAFGQSLFASELSRELVSTLAATLVTVAFCRAWAGSWRDGVPMAAIALIILIPLRVNALIFPINSMLGLRATMPLVVAIHILARRPGWPATFERAVLFALTIACGIEQGSATLAAFVAVEAVSGLRTHDWRRLTRSAISVVAGIVCFLLLVFLMSPSGFGSILRFNFVSLPGDQFWFFGGPPNRYIYRWEHFLIFLLRPGWTLLVVAMVVWSLVRFWKGMREADTRRTTAEAFLSVYAVASTASMLGTLNIVYFQPATRVAALLALFAVRREWLARKNDPRITDEVRGRVPTYAIATVFLSTAIGWPLATLAIVRTPAHIVYDHLIVGQRPTMNARWDTTDAIGRGIVAARRQALGRMPTVWSTYSSIVESDAGVFNPFFDYIIHALGHDNRVAYGTHFVADHPDIVQTISPTYTMYEEWLETNYWNFYRPLLRDYDIATVGPWSYFWLPRAKPWNEEPTLIADGPVPNGQLALAIAVSSVPMDSLALVEVTLNYHVVNPLRKIPVIGSLPRYMVHVSNAGNHFPLSLSPYETTRTFPVVMEGPTQIRLLGDPQSLIGHPKLVFDSIRVVRLRVAPENRQWARDFILGPPKPDTTDASRRR